jgi:hypothetical protein
MIGDSGKPMVAVARGMYAYTAQFVPDTQAARILFGSKETASPTDGKTLVLTKFATNSVDEIHLQLAAEEPVNVTRREQLNIEAEGIRVAARSVSELNVHTNCDPSLLNITVRSLGTSGEFLRLRNSKETSAAVY